MSKYAYSAVDNLEVMSIARKYNTFLINEVKRCGHGMKTALDFGAGIGTFPLALRESGMTVTCVETDRVLSDRLKDQGFSVYGDLMEVPLDSVEYVYSLNVFEHIDDDGRVARLLYERLTRGGTLLVYVPAFQILYSSMDRKVGHHRRYTRASLCRLLKETGFEIKKAEYIDCIGFIFSLAYRLFGNKRGDLNMKIIRFFDTILFPMSRFFDIFFRYFTGKNLMVVARKV